MTTSSCCPGAALFGPSRCTCSTAPRPRPARTRPARPPAETEAAFTTRVIQTARLHGWKVTHFRPARTAAGYRTAVQGDIGFPDLVLARRGVVIVAELKTARGKPTDEQEVWLAELGDLAVLWRPADWDLILAALAAPRPGETNE